MDAVIAHARRQIAAIHRLLPQHLQKNRGRVEDCDEYVQSAPMCKHVARYVLGLLSRFENIATCPSGRYHQIGMPEKKPPKPQIAESPIADVFEGRHPSDSEKRGQKRFSRPLWRNLPRSRSARPAA